MSCNYLIKVRSVNIVEGDKTENEVITHADFSLSDSGYSLSYKEEKNGVHEETHITVDEGKKVTIKRYAEIETDMTIEEGNVDDLLLAFKKFLERKELEKPLNTKITTKEYSVSARSSEIRTILKSKKKLYFEELFEEFNKNYIVVTFLSILDLARKQELTIEQENNFEKIYLLAKGCE